jgi:exodeoxyribonuclease III
MRVISINLNGIRSATEKGCFRWLARQDADVVCVQELKAHEHQIPRSASPRRYHRHVCCAERPGYSGVAIYSKKKPDRVITKLDWAHMDVEGRFIRADFGRLSISSIYIPSGSTGEVRQKRKYEVLDGLRKLLREMRDDGREHILCGDWNIAHTKLDLKNWRGNQKNSGFLPDERAFMDEVFGDIGLVDAFRVVETRPDQYTFWSNRGQAWAKNVGWRIDYQVITPGLKKKVVAASIYKRKRFADHAPLIIDYRHDL